MTRVFAHLISIVFHPLLMLTYMLIVMLLVNPYMFGYNTISEADTLILMVFLTSVLIPVIALFVMKGIGWVHSMEMTDRHERIGPYLVTSVLYLSLYLHLVKAKAFPVPLLIASLGAVIALFIGFFLNNFRKISMHAIAVGGFAILLVILFLRFSQDQFVLHLQLIPDIQIPSVFLLYLAILLAGLTCTARLLIERHTPSEVYSGLVVGLFSMTVSACILL